ncbi:MAG: hypothetical protein NVS9B2_23810 [Steroidobacteraceae bacterium]
MKSSASVAPVRYAVDTAQLRVLKGKLIRAIAGERSPKWCLALWARFIKARDAYRCVNCNSDTGIQAHHIFRRAAYQYGMLEPGNGITLCRQCHRKVHAAFNGRPVFSEPLNARGGDDQNEIAYLYGILHDDAARNGLEQDEFYYLADHMLDFFVKYQGYGKYRQLVREGRMSRIRFAHEAWRAAPENWYSYLGEVVGLALAAVCGSKPQPAPSFR